jgi:hypothetical protein
VIGPAHRSLASTGPQLTPSTRGVLTQYQRMLEPPIRFRSRLRAVREADLTLGGTVGRDRHRGGTLQGLCTIPEALWELGLGLYALIWGFRRCPILDAYDREFPAEKRELAPAY